jgi:NAD+ synthase (glutamine-hydrolysing)
MQVETISQSIRLAIAQINCTVGDIAGNSIKILAAASKAREDGASLLITPELALTGYPPEDLLLRDDFNHASEKALLELAKKTQGITLLVGHPRVYEGSCYNAAGDSGWKSYFYLSQACIT